jgi:hypothetical protein
LLVALCGVFRGILYCIVEDAFNIGMALTRTAVFGACTIGLRPGAAAPRAIGAHSLRPNSSASRPPRVRPVLLRALPFGFPDAVFFWSFVLLVIDLSIGQRIRGR